MTSSPEVEGYLRRTIRKMANEGLLDQFFS